MAFSFKLRRELLDQGLITNAYVDFPAKLMVNAGEVDIQGKKIYKPHTNFSDAKVETRFPHH